MKSSYQIQVTEDQLDYLIACGGALLQNVPEKSLSTYTEFNKEKITEVIDSLYAQRGELQKDKGSEVLPVAFQKKLRELEELGYVILLKWDGERSSNKKTVFISQPDSDFTFKRDTDSFVDTLTSAFEMIDQTTP